MTIEQNPELRNKISQGLAGYPNLLLLNFNLNHILACKQSNDEFVLRDIIELCGVDPYWASFLNKLDKNLGKVRGVYSAVKLSQKLASSPFSTAWELEVASYLLDKDIEFTPNFKTEGDSNVDFGIKIGAHTILMDAYVRRLKTKEEEYSGSSDFTRDLKRTIEEKKLQNGISEAIRLPWILAIDGTYAGIDEFNVKRILDSENDATFILSAILLKRPGSYFLIVNNYAKNLLSNEMIKMLK